MARYDEIGAPLLRRRNDLLGGVADANRDARRDAGGARARRECRDLAIEAAPCALDDGFRLDVLGELRRPDHADDRELARKATCHVQALIKGLLRRLGAVVGKEYLLEHGQSPTCCRAYGLRLRVRRSHSRRLRRVAPGDGGGRTRWRSASARWRYR